MVEKRTYQTVIINDIKSFEKTMNKVKKYIVLFDKIFSTGKINGCQIIRKISGKYHLLKKDLLECDLFLYSNIIRKKKIPDLKKKLLLVKYFKKNIRVIEDYADHIISGDTATSIDILAIVNILLGFPMLIMTYYCMNFRDAKFKPILNLSNLGFFILIFIIVILLILFMRSPISLERFHNFMYSIPNDELLNQIFFDAQGKISNPA